MPCDIVNDNGGFGNVNTSETTLGPKITLHTLQINTGLMFYFIE